MKKNFFYVLFFLLAVIFLQASPSYQTSSITGLPGDSTKVIKTMLMGTVSSSKYGEVRNPIAGATVIVFDKTKKQLAEVQTDANGCYEVDLSAYAVIEVDVIVSAKGHITSASNKRVPRKATTRYNINLEVDK